MRTRLPVRPRQAAQLLGVSDRAFRKWIRAGLVRVKAGGVPLTELRRLARERGVEIEVVVASAA